MPGRTAVVLGMLGSFLCMPALAGDEPRLSGELGTAVTARLAEQVEAQELVGISLALVRNGEIVHVEHAGWEDREAQIPASSRTMYRWASISKPLTAVAAMQLWEQGTADLDADVRLLVPEFPEQPRPITLRQILCHQSGIVHYANGQVVKTPRPELDGRYADVIDALDTFKASPLVCDPGSKYSYSTHAYILGGAVVQRAGGQPYAAQVHRRIVSTLGMTSLRPDYQWEQIPGRAVGYRPQRGPQGEVQMVVSTDTDVSWKLPGGGFISSVADLALFGAGMLEDKLVKPETRELMWTAQKTADGTQTPYGLGFQIGEYKGRKVVSHGGSQEKARTVLLMLPDSRVAVAVMCNTESAILPPIANAMLDVLIGEPAGADPAPVPAKPASP
jgi:serine beta-lactamase-like protein LACTB, mitochondrial